MIAERSHSRSLVARRREGFTLLEILVVVAIIVILAGVATFAYTRYLDDAKEDSARQSAKVLEQGIKNYMLRYGQVPDTLTVLIAPPDGSRPFVENGEAALMDPWGKPYKLEIGQTVNGDPDPYVYTTNPASGKTLKAIGRP